MKKWSMAFLASAFLFAACGDDGNGGTPDAAPSADARPADAGSADAGSADAGAADAGS